MSSRFRRIAAKVKAHGDDADAFAAKVTAFVEREVEKQTAALRAENERLRDENEALRNGAAT